jgi:hypothetical protein
MMSDAKKAMPLSFAALQKIVTSFARAVSSIARRQFQLLGPTLQTPPTIDVAWFPQSN